MVMAEEGQSPAIQGLSTASSLSQDQGVCEVTIRLTKLRQASSFLQALTSLFLKGSVYFRKLVFVNYFFVPLRCKSFQKLLTSFASLECHSQEPGAISL
jgi:hypothetical protein